MPVNQTSVLDALKAAQDASTGNINTNISGTVALPTGASTAAKQDTGNTSVASIDSKVPALGQALAAASVPVVLTSAQITTLTPLSTVTIGAGTAVIGHVIVDTTPTTAVTQSGTWTVQPGNTANTTAWKIDGSAVTQPVSLATAPIDQGYTVSEFARNDYTSTSVTTSAYVQLIASTGSSYQEFEIFDSSGQTLKIAFGAAASEVDKFQVLPGGNGRIKRNVPSGTRVSIKAVSATASVGEISLNLYG